MADLCIVNPLWSRNRVAKWQLAPDARVATRDARGRAQAGRGASPTAVCPHSAQRPRPAPPLTVF